MKIKNLKVNKEKIKKVIEQKEAKEKMKTLTKNEEN